MNEFIMPLAAPVAKSIQLFKPNRTQEQVVTDALGYLQIVAPFWSSLSYRSLPVRYTYDVPRLATDQSYCYVNPDALVEHKWTIPNVAFGIAHEDCHYIRNDIILSMVWKAQGSVPCKGGPLPYDHELMGAAKDYVINAMLIDGKVGEFPPEGLFDPKLSARGMESSIDIYEILYKRKQAEQKALRPGMQMPKPSAPGQGDPGKGKGPGNFDQHLDPSDEAVRQEARSGTVTRQQSISMARMVAESAGKGNLPAGIQQLIGEMLTPTVRWQDHLRSEMHRASGTPANNWNAVNKRLISRPDPYSPIIFARREEYGCGTIVIGYDTSGSCISAATQTKFFSEMAGIVADLNPEKLIVLWCDQEIQRVDEIEDAEELETLRAEINELGGAPGGGGTSFVPVFDWVADSHVEPDMLIYLTDTLGVFPGEPDYPVIWCSLVNDATVPFGELVEIKE